MNDESRQYVKDLEKNLHESTGEVEYLLGFLYLKGNLVDKDFDKAIRLFKKSHEKNYWDATVVLIIMNYFGYDMDKNEEEIDEYMNVYVDGQIENKDDYPFGFEDHYELYDLLKVASGKYDDEILNMIVNFYLGAANDADNIP